MTNKFKLRYAKWQNTTRISVGLLSGLLIGLVQLCFSGCGYRIGSPERTIPGGYHQINVPVFKNHTHETGIEVGFTNALIHEFERSRTARIVDAVHAEAKVDGEIIELKYLPGSDRTLGYGATLKTGYTINLKVRVTLRRRSDDSVLWAGHFEKSTDYSAPQVTLAGINSVNPLYNLSARRQKIEGMALDMMAEAHDRMSESF